MTRILVVEDTIDIALGVQDHLTAIGYQVRIAPTGAEALALHGSWSPDVMILDLMLPDVSGYDVLQSIRTRGAATPVLILSAKSDETAKIKGFRDGADDYVTKPFGIRELAARVHVLARRAALLGKAPRRMEFGALTVDADARRVSRDGLEIPLRPKEYDLIITLIDRRHEVVTRQALLNQVWAYERDVESRTVDWHVAEVRRKLGDQAGTPQLIETVRKTGYRWIAPRTDVVP